MPSSMEEAFPLATCGPYLCLASISSLTWAIVCLPGANNGIVDPSPWPVEFFVVVPLGCCGLSGDFSQECRSLR